MPDRDRLPPVRYRFEPNRRSRKRKARSLGYLAQQMPMWTKRRAVGMSRRAILTAGLMLVSVSASGQSLQQGWIADARTGCRVWHANPQLDASVAWSGACRNGLGHEPGVLQWALNGRLDTGEGGPRTGSIGSHAVATWVMSGPGVATWANGDRYDGEWRNGNMDGHGVAIWANGNRYDGEWRDSRMDGRGIQVDADGSRYDGQWRDGLPNGIGKMVLSNGESYTGVWVNGCYRNGNQTALFGVDRSSCQ
jgi:hypothetical protein